MDTQKTITVLGAGYVGLTTAALFSHAGYTVYAIEPNEKRLAAIKEGRSFFYEEGIDAIIAKGLSQGTLIPTNSYADSVPKSHIVFSAVGTPDNPDGSSNLTYVFESAKEAASHLADGSIYVQKSTVPVGTGERVKKEFEALGKNIAYVSNPEFLREGTAIADTLYFDRVVVGGDNKDALEEVLNIYRDLEKVRDSIADFAHIKTPPLSEHGEYIATTLASAELIKVTSNAFLALKISFANSIAKLSDAAGADIKEVMNAVGSDKRIGRAFLNAGRGYGGGCFPKDVSGLISSSSNYGVALPIMEAVRDVNASMPEYIQAKLSAIASEPLENLSVAVLGLSFKAGTSDTRRSPGIAIANNLATGVKKLYAFDPQANEEASHDLTDRVTLVETLDEALKSADAIVIATEWPEFTSLTPDAVKNASSAQIVVDAMNVLDKQSFLSAGFQYTGVGR